MLEEWLTTRRGSRVSIGVPARGDKRRLLGVVTTNAKESFIRHKLRRASDFAARSRALAELGDRLGLADPNVLAYVWINRFPMYRWDAEKGRWDATHNPFSAPVPDDVPLLESDPGAVRALQAVHEAPDRRALRTDPMRPWRRGRLCERQDCERRHRWQGCLREAGGSQVASISSAATSLAFQAERSARTKVVLSTRLSKRATGR